MQSTGGTPRRGTARVMERVLRRLLDHPYAFPLAGLALAIVISIARNFHSLRSVLLILGMASLFALWLPLWVGRRSRDPAGSSPLETVRVQGRPDLGSRGREIAGLIAEGTPDPDANQALVLPDPATGEPLRATRVALGLAGHTGVVIAASRRSSFPTPFERFLLQSIITQAEVALRNAALMTALHHALHCEQVARADAEAANRAKDLLNEELERRVVERTRQLSLVNQDLTREIAERKRAEEALRESEQRFRDYAETASDWLWETGPDHSFTRVSEDLTTPGIDPAGRIGVTRWHFATDVEEEPEKALSVTRVPPLGPPRFRSGTSFDAPSRRSSSRSGSRWRRRDTCRTPHGLPEESA